MNLDSSRILSQPVRIRWAGWETDTYRLQRSGWDISADQNIERCTMRLALRNRDISISGVTDTIRDFNNRRDMPHGLYFNCRLASHFHITDISYSDDMKFAPIDAQPAYVESKMKNLEDFAFFRSVNTNAKEVFLREASMDEILEIALQKQEPQQEVIRKKLIHRERMEKIKRHSNVEVELRLIA